MATRAHTFLLLACLPAISVVAHADVCDNPIELPSKPDLGDYADYGAFVVDIMSYKATEEEKRKHRQDCPELYQEAPMIITDAPEDLEEAVSRADSPGRAAEQASTDSDRSTSRDFPLPQQGSDMLSGLYLGTSLDLLDPAGATAQPDPSQLMSFIYSLVDEPENDITDPQRRDERFPDSPDFLFEAEIPLLGPLQLVDISIGDRVTILLRADGSQRNRTSTIMQSCLSSCMGQ